MNHEHNDPLVDVCLAELIGGQTPPDLSERILAAWLQQRTASVTTVASVSDVAPTVPTPAISLSASNGHAATPLSAASPAPISVQPNHAPISLTPVSLGTSPGVRPEVPVSSVSAISTQAVSASQVNSSCEKLPTSAATTLESYQVARQRRRSRMRWLSVAACLLLAIGGYAAFKNLPQSGSNHLAGHNAAPAGGQSAATAEGKSRKLLSPEERQILDRQIAAANEGITVEELTERERLAQQRREQQATIVNKLPKEEIRVDGNTAIPFTASPTPPQQEAQPPRSNSGNSLASASGDDDVVGYINQMIRERWETAGVTPSVVATDSEWVRRVYLDILGRIPTGEETTRFISDKSKDKRPRLVDRLLDSDDYIEEFARNWTTIWTNILIGRNGGTEQNSMVSRDGLQQYLRRAMLANKPYNDMVHDLVSAKGSNSPGAEDFNGATNFILHNLDENATPATAKTAKIFLGLQVQCTQCHNHPFNDWKQDRFWQLNSFFRQTRGVRMQTAENRNAARLGDQDFFGEGDKSGEGAEIYYELRNGLLKVAYPVFLDGTSINPSGLIAEVNRREELAKLIVRSPNMPAAHVNRMWGHFLGYGFTKPVDDMGPHNSASHPELLERLGQDFANHGFDNKQLIRWITLTEAYSLSSRVTPKNSKDDPAMGERPLFSHFYLRQMRAEELYQSLIVATGAQRTGGGDYAAQERRKADWLRQFTIAFGTDEKDETTTFNGTIPQTLMMWNGELVNNAISGSQGTFLHQVAGTNSQPAKKLNQLFLTALSRNPTNKEIQIANAAWVARKGDTMGALQDVWWVVLNTNEFIFNH